MKGSCQSRGVGEYGWVQALAERAGARGRGGARRLQVWERKQWISPPGEGDGMEAQGLSRCTATHGQGGGAWLLVRKHNQGASHPTCHLCCCAAARAGMKELFKSIDEDKSGTITVVELRNALSHWGHKISEVRGLPHVICAPSTTPVCAVTSACDLQSSMGARWLSAGGDG